MQGSIRKRGNTYSWSFDLGYVDGKRKRKEKGGYHTKAECQKALREAIKQYENSGTVFEPSEITVADYMDFWLKEHSINIKYNTVKLYFEYIKVHIKPSIGSYKLKSITPAILQDFINNLYNKGYSKSVVSTMLAVLTCSFKKAVYPYQYIKDNPAQYVSIPKYTNQPKSIEDKIITDEDFSKIINKYKDTCYYVPLMIMYYTGFRLGECLGLTWDSVDFEKGTISVKTNLIEKIGIIWSLGTPKTPTSVRTIYVSQTLLNILYSHKKKQLENRLFYGVHYTNYWIDEDTILHTESKSNYKPVELVCTRENGNLLVKGSLSGIAHAIKKNLGIDFHFHALRHTHATKLIEAGANMKDVQYRLGHSNYSTTANTYSHVTESMDKESVKLFDKLVDVN